METCSALKSPGDIRRTKMKYFDSPKSLLTRVSGCRGGRKKRVLWLAGRGLNVIQAHRLCWFILLTCLRAPGTAQETPEFLAGKVILEH